MGNRSFEIIRNLIQGARAENTLVDGDSKLMECSYLLMQAIRLYRDENTRDFVSQEALNLWTKLTSKSIFDYKPNDNVKVETDDFYILPLFRGMEKDMEEKLVGRKIKSFRFNRLFIEDYIVPVSMIKDQLLNLDYLSDEKIKDVLSNISTCRILKTEDQNITSKNKRSLDYKECIRKYYKDITVLDCNGNPVNIEEES